MNFAKLLRPEAVRVLTAASSKKRLLHEIGDLVGGVYQLDAGMIVESLLARESLGPTGVGNGVALPHARVEGLDSVVGAFVLLDRPVEFDAVDRQPVDIAFSLFAPLNAGVEHLKALALVSRTLRDASIRAKLRANPNPTTIYAILAGTQKSQAA
jgi:PTS system nitrogen regulatory IIA component